MTTMKSTPFLARLLSLFALVGMLIVPVSTGAADGAKTDMSKTAVAAMEQMAGTGGDMSCCPDGRAAKPACEKCCPFVIICSPSAPPALLKADWTPVSLSWADHTYGELRFERLSSLATEPPARPPKA